MKATPAAEVHIRTQSLEANTAETTGAKSKIRRGGQKQRDGHRRRAQGAVFIDRHLEGPAKPPRQKPYARSKKPVKPSQVAGTLVIGAVNFASGICAKPVKRSNFAECKEPSTAKKKECGM